jgi:(p)ppGpp synthase/HD superfamily hydrolase
MAIEVASGADEHRVPPPFVLESDAVSLAFFVARSAHAGQTRRGDGTPYLDHPLLVAELLDREGCDEETIAAALLHDVVEDSALTVGDVVEAFGVGVGELVAALTDDPGIEAWEDRKGVLRASVAAAGTHAVSIYLADKIANLRDWQAVYAAIGERAVERFKAPTIDARVRVWQGDLEMAERFAPDCGLTAQLRTELAAFEHELAAHRRAPALSLGRR